MPANEKFLNQLFSEDDLSWKSLIMDAVRSNDLDPWDIDLGFISGEFITRLQALKEMNFKISGKVILASAILLKLKSKKFLSHEITALDELIASTAQSMEEEDEYMDDSMEGYEDENGQVTQATGEDVKVFPRTPQPRKRKVSVYDLIEALEHALESNKRKQSRVVYSAPDVKIPERGFDISASINHMYRAVSRHYLQKEGSKRLTFSQLLPSTERQDIVYTFLPLLHLENLNKINLHQKEHFDDFSIDIVGTAKEDLENEFEAVE